MHLGLHGTRGRARSCCVEVSEANAVAGKLVEIGRSDLSSKAGKVTEAQVIGHDEQEVWALVCAICCV